VPILECESDGMPGFKWGEEGNCITYGAGTDRTREEALDTVRSQAAAITDGFENLEYMHKVSDETLNYTLGIVYEPNEVDLQNHFGDEEVIRKAMWNFMEKLQNKTDEQEIAMSLFDSFIKLTKGDADQVRIEISEMDMDLTKVLNDMHTDTKNIGTIVECYQAPVDFELNGEEVKKGTWLLGVVWEDEYFNKILNEERTGLSLEGKGLLQDVGGD